MPPRAPQIPSALFRSAPSSKVASLLDAARAGDERAFERLTTPYVRELHVHCYRMLGSLHDSEDVLQETLVRAWRHLGSYAGRSSFRHWLYTIATNASLRAIERRPRVLLFPSGEPVDGDGAAPVTASIEQLQPYPDALLPDPDPAVRLELRESVALAFLAAIQHLPPRQRAAVLLFDVLGWSAAEVAEQHAAAADRLPDPIGEDLLETAREAFVQAMQVTALASAAIAVGAAVLAALLLRRERRAPHHDERTARSPEVSVEPGAALTSLNAQPGLSPC